MMILERCLVMCFPMKESDEETGRGWKRKKGEKSLREVGYLSVSLLK